MGSFRDFPGRYDRLRSLVDLSRSAPRERQRLEGEVAKLCHRLRWAVTMCLLEGLDRYATVRAIQYYTKRMDGFRTIYSEHNILDVRFELEKLFENGMGE